jgi:2-phosphosulfolactate phosphatase
MVDSLDNALALRSSGVGDYCIGERDSIKPPGFDFGNSPAELSVAQVAGKTLIQTTSNGTAGINAARGADRIYAGAFIMRSSPSSGMQAEPIFFLIRSALLSPTRRLWLRRI